MRSAATPAPWPARRLLRGHAAAGARVVPARLRYPATVRNARQIIRGYERHPDAAG
jgi:hypothetical protein